MLIVSRNLFFSQTHMKHLQRINNCDCYDIYGHKFIQIIIFGGKYLCDISCTSSSNRIFDQATSQN